MKELPTTKYMTSKNGDRAFHQKGTQENHSGWLLVLESHGSEHPLVDSPGKGSHGSSPHQPGYKYRCRKLYILQDKKKWKSYLGASPARNPFNPLSLNVPITAEPNLVFEWATCIIGKNKKVKQTHCWTPENVWVVVTHPPASESSPHLQGGWSGLPGFQHLWVFKY